MKLSDVKSRISPCFTDMKIFFFLLSFFTSFFLITVNVKALDQSDVYHNQGWEQVNAGNFNKAEELFRKAVELNSDNGNFKRSLGWLLYDRLNRPSDALNYLIKASQLIPDDTNTQLDLALTYDKLKKFEQSVATFDKALVLFKQQNKKPPVWVYLSSGSSCIWGVKPADNKKAKGYLLKVIESDYDAASKKTAYDWLSFAQLELKQYDELLISMNKAIEFDKTVPLFYRRKAAALENLGRFNESLDELFKAVPLSVNEPWVYAELSNVYIKLKKYKEAVDSYEKAIPLLKQTNQKIPVWIYNNIAAWSLFEINPKDYNRVIKYANCIIEGDYEIQQKKEAYKYLAQTYYNQIKIKEAYTNAKLAGDDFWLTKMLSPRTIIFSMTFPFNKLMKKIYSNVSPGIISFNLPMDTAYQKFVSLESNIPYKEIIKKGRFNIVYYDFSKGFPDLLKLKITVKNEIISQSSDLIASYKGSDQEISYFANLANDYYDLNNPVLHGIIKKITDGYSTQNERIKIIHKWTAENIIHIGILNPDITPEQWPVYKTVSEIVNAKKGHCVHISDVFMALCRIEKIPVRMINGIAMSADVNKTKGKTEWHYVVELYDNAKDMWIYVEPQSISNFGINQFWHIVFDTETKEKKPDNFLRINDFLFETQYFDPGNHCTYEIKQ
jgi:tetratricopeptide (TPR) repeat protein